MSEKFLYIFICLLKLTNSWMVYDIEKMIETYGSELFISKTSDKGAGSPLILTHFLERGKINEARNASYVEPFLDNVLSYSGYFTVDKRYNSNMFFWYFVSEESPQTAPVLIWLQGGPGGSSLYGLFNENGPYMVNSDGNIQKSNIYWTKTMHVIYIDNPVGTGFSFTKKGGYLTDEESIGKQMYEFLQQFFTMFPSLRSNDLYISGESYAGKYIPAIANAIKTTNHSSNKRINLKGVAIGNGFSDPINQIDYGNVLLGIGLIDAKQNLDFQTYQESTRNYIKNNQYNEAMTGLRKILGSSSSLFVKYTGYTYPYNYLVSDRFLNADYSIFLNQSSTRKAIHVGNIDYYMLSLEVYNHLQGDIMQSVAHWVAQLANNYKVLLFNGQLDIIVAYQLTVDYLNKLEWCGSKKWTNTDRKQWYVNKELAGYIKTLKTEECNGSLSLVMVRNAGHMVPSDQPAWAYNLIKEFTQSDFKIY